MTDSQRDPALTAPSRRSFLVGSQLLLSGAAVALMSGVPTRAFAGTRGARAQDITILNTAIGAEHEAVAAYQLGAESGLLSSAVLSVAVTFQGHHKEHVEALAKAVQQLGGSPAEPLDKYTFPVSSLTSEAAVLEFAAKLERGAVSAYAGAIPLFEDRDLSNAAASILADEAMHWAVLRSALGLDPVPGAFFS
ncbi:MAG: ferritin-like domain-containing protein [Alphaproteobacteria bacterium]|nr:ferritin-like domain-containing protein [Alphaproteobacteria bacterium]MCB9686053.1 ferritin-like domain-containing protein [Alphaproteobacteria bacterium]